jgi:ACS family pantothenate transporter-like MFS transporter
MVNTHFAPLDENVARKDVAHISPAGVEGNIDVSAKNQSWKSYFWDSWDKSPEVRSSLRNGRRSRDGADPKSRNGSYCSSST